MRKGLPETCTPRSYVYSVDYRIETGTASGVDYFWRDALNQAIARNRRDAHHRYIHLATLGEDGYPANRTVVFRGFGDAGELKIVTDRRSGKVSQIAASSAAEVSFERATHSS